MYFLDDNFQRNYVEIQNYSLIKVLEMASIKKILVVFTTKTRGDGSGQLLTSLWIFNRGLANF